jgi:hypothetical protein
MWLHGFANVLRPSAKAQSVVGALAAEAACQIGQYIFNFMTHAEGLLSMKPLRTIPDPPRKHFEYEASTNRLVMASMGCNSMWMPSGRGSEAELEGPLVLKMLGIVERHDGSIEASETGLKRKGWSGSSKSTRPRCGPM